MFKLIKRIKESMKPDLEKAAAAENDMRRTNRGNKVPKKVEQRMEAEVDAAIASVTEILKRQICWGDKCYIEVHTKDLVKLVVTYYQDTPESMVINVHDHEFQLSKIEKKRSVSGNYLDLTFDVK